MHLQDIYLSRKRVMYIWDTHPLHHARGSLEAQRAPRIEVRKAAWPVAAAKASSGPDVGPGLLKPSLA